MYCFIIFFWGGGEDFFFKWIILYVLNRAMLCIVVLFIGCILVDTFHNCIIILVV